MTSWPFNRTAAARSVGVVTGWLLASAGRISAAVSQTVGLVAVAISDLPARASIDCVPDCNWTTFGLLLKSAVGPSIQPTQAPKGATT